MKHPVCLPAVWVQWHGLMTILNGGGALQPDFACVWPPLLLLLEILNSDKKNLCSNYFFLPQTCFKYQVTPGGRRLGVCQNIIQCNKREWARAGLSLKNVDLWVRSSPICTICKWLTSPVEWRVFWFTSHSSKPYRTGLYNSGLPTPLTQRGWTQPICSDLLTPLIQRGWTQPIWSDLLIPTLR